MTLSSEFLGFRKDDAVVCYDYFKARASFPGEKIIYDVKTLYDLEGYDTEDLINLATKVLGRGRVLPYMSIIKRGEAFWRSYKVAQIDYTRYPLDKLIPSDMVAGLYEKRKELIAELFEKAQEKEFYRKFYPVLGTLFEIASNPVYVDLPSIKEDNSHFSNLIRQSAKEGKLYLQFNPVGAKTGRLSFKKGTVNVYILPKELRKCIVAPPDYQIVQMDFKSFQPRLAIFCTDNESFKSKFANVEDIYSVFPGDREENKISFISWMFSQRRHPVFDVEASALLDLRKKLYSKVKQNGKLTNKFGRTLYFDKEEDNVILQNYVTSTEVDVILSIMIGVHSSLKGKKSRIIFPFHDSLVFYIHKDEMHLVDEIKSYMEGKHRTLFGADFPVSVKSGSNLENLT